CDCWHYSVLCTLMSRLPLTLLASLRFGKPSLSHVNGERDIAPVDRSPSPSEAGTPALRGRRGWGMRGKYITRSIRRTLALFYSLSGVKIYVLPYSPMTIVTVSGGRS